MRFTIWSSILGCVTLLLAGCAAGPRPRNMAGAAWQPGEQRVDAVRCQPASFAAPASGSAVALAALGGDAPRLAAGDRVRLGVLGDPDRLTGTYVVGADGALAIPDVAPIGVAGLTVEQAGRTVRAALLAAGQIRSLAGATDLRLVENVGVNVAVSGAVFQPGQVRAGERAAEVRAAQRDGVNGGDANNGRTVSAAIRGAGGVRPDADLTHVVLQRGERWTVLDLSDLLDGGGIGDYQLAAGDRVIVPSTGCFDAGLVRPTPLTMGGVRVFLSNLSRPSSSNAVSAVDKEAQSLPYGTRLLQALASMNCVGGSAMNARRHAILVSRNPLNGQSVAIEREVERLMRDADRDAQDPYLMPGDVVACYDSRWMNFSDAVGFIGGAVNTATPAIVLSRAIR